MKEILEDIDRWQIESDQKIALATVVKTWGSAPRKAGAKLALTADGRFCGSVSGGCVEGAVIEAGQATLANGKPQLLSYGVADETAWEVGLACGGSIEVFVEVLDTAVYQFSRDLITQEKAGATITIITGPEDLVGRKLSIARSGAQIGSLGTNLDVAALQIAQTANQSQKVQLAPDVEAFVDMYRPAPTLVMVGGVHIAIALAKMAQTIGYYTIVVDPRRAFGSDERFPHADRLLTLWPQKAFAEIDLTPDTAVALLTHDPKIDDPALKILLDTPVFYIGALGSRKTHAKRVGRLQAIGFSDDKIGRIQAPIGLDIGAYNPEEIALSVLAEIVRTRRRDFT